MKEYRLTPLVWLALGMLVSAILAACADRAAPRFPHRMHLAEIECGTEGKPECLTCASCHAVSERDRAHKLPQGELCIRCHREDAHEVLPLLRTRPQRVSGAIQFNHDQHLAMRGIRGQCVGCHSGVVREGGATLPPMSRCFSCHEHEQQWQKGKCAPCHVQANLERTLPESFLRHDQAFARGHGQVAQQERQLCQACHTESQCDDCHDVTQDLTVERRRPERILRTYVHRGDFLTRHMIEAESQPSRCLRCHTAETCDSCHVARGVSGNRIGARSPHPPRWVGSDPGVRSLHGREARRDILSCASCHDQGPATNCIRCHSVGGVGGNPHPDGWQSTLTESSTMCRYCHG